MMALKHSVKIRKINIILFSSRVHTLRITALESNMNIKENEQSKLSTVFSYYQI